jgi:hypothetical protein
VDPEWQLMVVQSSVFCSYYSDFNLALSTLLSPHAGWCQNLFCTLQVISFDSILWLQADEK